MALIRFTKTRPEMHDAVNFALLQAVLHNRPTWIDGLVRLGGSIEAYNYEPLKVAAKHDHAEMLATVMLCGPTLPGLYAVCETVQTAICGARY